MTLPDQTSPAAVRPAGGWLETVPDRWRVAMIKRFYDIQLGKMLQTEPHHPGDKEVRYLKAKHVHWFDVRVTNGDTMWASVRELDRFGVIKGDLLVCEGGEGGRCGIAGRDRRFPSPCIIQNALHRVRPRIIANGGGVASRNDYLQYVLRTIAEVGWFDALNDKATIAHFTAEKFGALLAPIPSVTEQAVIARFVDHADRRIQRRIRAKEKLIALLEEHKQAVIHQAVTGQIDVRTGKRYRAYKDSGMEWLGKVPAHWDVSALTRVALEVSDYRGATPTKREAGVFLVTAKNVRRGWIDYETSREFVAEDEYDVIMRRGFPGCGDLLLTTEAPLGHASLVDREHVALAQRVIRLRLDPELLLPEYALRSVLAPCFQDQLLCRGTGSTALGIKASKLPQLKVALPPLQEQCAILAHIAASSIPSDTLQDLASRQIERWREYRTRLIADVVTGKLDVRGAAAGLAGVDPLNGNGMVDGNAISMSNRDLDEPESMASPEA